MKTIAKTLLLIVCFVFIASSANNYAANAVPGGDDEGYLAFAEKMPAPVGGLEGIYKRIEYPRMAKQAGVQGKVYILAFINEGGGVDDVKVLKGIGAGCDEEVVEAVKNSKFEPGSHKGQAVKVKLSLSFVFKLQ